MCSGKLKSKIGAAILVVTMVPTAWGWDGTPTGKISEIHAAARESGASGNFDFRVGIEGKNSTFCGGNAQSAWGYFNADDANFKGMSAVLMTAYTLGKTVTLYVTKDAPGYCKIGYIVLGAQ
jgi:hypothetical protein